MKALNSWQLNKPKKIDNQAEKIYEKNIWNQTKSPF